MVHSVISFTYLDRHQMSIVKKIGRVCLAFFMDRQQLPRSPSSDPRGTKGHSYCSSASSLHLLDGSSTVSCRSVYGSGLVLELCRDGDWGGHRR